MNREEILKLAKLARIEISDAEIDTLSREFDSILKYVSDVKNVGEAEVRVPKPEDFPVRNVMREDSEGHEEGIHTEDILKEAPRREGDYLKVKKIL